MTDRRSTERVLRATGWAWRMTDPTFPMIRDAHQKSVGLYRLDQYAHEANRTAELPDAVFNRIRDRLLAKSRRGLGWPPVLLLVVAGFFLATVLSRIASGSPRWPWIWAPLSMIIYFGFRAATYRYRIPRVDREFIVDAMLLERRCPSCAYDLSATIPGPDSIATCPECGASWIVPSPP
jgi:hypothetical protein